MYGDLNRCPCSRGLLQNIQAEGYQAPTPIQEKSIPHVLARRDLFGCAQTGTGKTAAFCRAGLVAACAGAPAGESAARPRLDADAGARAADF